MHPFFSFIRVDNCTKSKADAFHNLFGIRYLLNIVILFSINSLLSMDIRYLVSSAVTVHLKISGESTKSREIEQKLSFERVEIQIKRYHTMKYVCVQIAL